MNEVVTGYCGDESNYHVTRPYTIALTRTGAKLHHQVTIDLVNHMPCGISDRTSTRSPLG